MLNVFFFLFIGCIISNRVWLFFTVNMDCIDNDQPIMWLGAKHYSQGLFYEPRFYGQDYNSMLEALIAVPFIKLGLPVYYAVPIATHLIFLTPFLFTAIYLFLKEKKETAVFVLAVLLCMPVGYDMMNAIPRGFVTGVFFTSLFIVSLLNPNNYRFILINTWMAYVGYLINQNSVLVSAPFLFYIFLINYKDKNYYIYSVIGFLPALPIDYLLNHFYKIHPNYVFYPANNSFSFEFFKEAITHLDQRFAHISFFIEERSFLLLLIFMIIAIVFFKKNKKAFFSFLVFICVLIVSVFSSKVSDGIVWPFYSYSRMYLGIPIAIYLLVSTSVDFRKGIYVLIPVALLFHIYKEIHFKKEIAYHTQEKMWGHVHLNKLTEILDALNLYKNKCKEQGVTDFVIINSVWHDDEINYAGPALYDDFPNTFKPSFERRTWRIEEEKKHVHEKFIIYIADYNFDNLVKEKYKHIDITRLDDYGLFLITNNTLTTVDFVKSIGATTEGF
ncbi:MAG: hypothetical protein HY062_03145 [Bacteroidetes bacterium]|nr:hypothetical protein [Bacteroidota bacterium]